MEDWICENLSQILDFPVTNEIVQYMIQIQNERDLDDYMRSFLDYTNGKHRQFITDFKKQQALIKDQAKCKKEDDMDNGKKKQNEKKKGKVKSKESKENKQIQENVKVEKLEKKKPKFESIYSQDGKNREILLKGRHKCDCEAKRHTLINNCLNCGRIVCAQEGAGPCFFCGELVCSEKEQTILSSNTKQGDQLYNKLMNQKPNKNLEESIKQRDKLLEYDRNGIQGTKVIDDECDYYQSNNIWFTAEQREKLRTLEEEKNKKKHMSHLNKKIYAILDFTGRIIEENLVEEDFEFSEEQLRDISESFNEFEISNVCPNIEFKHPMYIGSSVANLRTSAAKISSKTKNIIQDKEYLEMSDLGLCLSMHQPYASLLVSGIKIHEGRSWYSSHRGRLWIAATSKTPTREEISNVEQYYRVLKNEKLKFPEIYPTSCLLGCVTVVDVLPQDEYKKCYPEGESSDSSYVFICENFLTLPIKFPIQGNHKIYKLNRKIHQAALKILEKFSKNVK
ncbi:activating signal cointegrator 1 isoform X2 [Apis mellifera]|uniref:Activating signal cointegrator 1 isoform X2 n=1 Tax=Apis mellifera TaxID=7460 RepID=A0A7M7LN13_APIME|nr:activating signal cointegrator 1 isoform X2 [Apis mellifera]|eukprot:XP_006563094.1 activating signal cointegrator 1 isoform X2 [Apis mellifera]